MKLLTTNELADLVGVVPDTVAIWRKTGRGPKFILVGGQYRYNLRDVERWLKAQTFESTGEAQTQ